MNGLLKEWKKSHVESTVLELLARGYLAVTSIKRGKFSTFMLDINPTKFKEIIYSKEFFISIKVK